MRNIFVVIASSRNSERQIMKSGTDQSELNRRRVGFQRLILKSSNLLAVCGVGVDESCTVKVRS